MSALDDLKRDMLRIEAKIDHIGRELDSKMTRKQMISTAAVYALMAFTLLAVLLK